MPRFCPSCGADLVDKGKFCSECGTPIPVESAIQRNDHSAVVSAAIEADRPTQFQLWLTVALLGVLVLGIAAMFANWTSTPEPVVIIHGPDYDKPATPTAPRPPASATATAEPTLPSQAISTTAAPEHSLPTTQTEFTSMVESFIPSYNSADTEIRKTNVRFERKDAIARYFSASGSLRFQEWVGQVEALRTESDGEAAVSIRLKGSSTVIKTWNNSFSDSWSHTMISRNDSLYSSLMSIRDGEEVAVSGTFILADHKPDYVEEASVTEEGSMATPEFIVRFSEIKASSTPRQSDNAN